MAVQAQYPLNPFRSGVWEEHEEQFHQPGYNPLAAYQGLAGGAQIFNGGAVFSEPQSELTCNLSGNRKRGRGSQAMGPRLQSKVQVMDDAPPFIYDQNSLHADSGPASTSGRRCQDLHPYLPGEALKFEDFVRFENQKLRAMVEELRKKHCRSLLGMIERKTVERLQEKEMELEKATKVNAELEEKVKQMCAENQMWFNVAKNSEATVSSLRLSLEQVLLQNAGGHLVEGFGETDGSGAHNAQSCSSYSAADEGPDRAKRRRTCRSCGSADVSVLVLPCRHLCLCKDCESTVLCCPVCNTIKNATLQVFLS